MKTSDDQEPFHCIICLELVYKPIVHACGHLFCFWCVHRAMNGNYKSLCPLCRRPYMHFPRVCEQLHFFLLKAVREEYLIRGKEVQEEEAIGGVYSPQLDDETTSNRVSCPVATKEVLKIQSTVDPTSATRTEGPSSSGQSPDIGADVLHSCSSNCISSPSLKQMSLPQLGSACEYDPSGKGKAPVETEQEDEVMRTSSSENDEGAAGAPNKATEVTVSDLTCPNCSKLLYRPVVLNCGHMFCERCVLVSQSCSDHTLSCPLCKSNHPGLFPQVCLELHHYIDRVFPLEYTQRFDEVAREESEDPSNRPDNIFPDPESSTKELRTRASQGPIHRDVGCDGCGMRPIVGKRFKCEDCLEAIGYDLCAKCYKLGCVMGRFNQRHTPEHRMSEMPVPGRRSSSIARQFLDVMASSISPGDFNTLAQECDELVSIHMLQALDLRRRSGTGLGVPGSEVEIPQSTGAGEPDGDGDLDGYFNLDLGLELLEHGDENHNDSVHDANGVEEFLPPLDEEEFENFRREDEDIEFYRVAFYS